VFHEYIKPSKNIPQAIVEHTGITNEFVMDKRPEGDVLLSFFE
jgi:DNA polymerase III epsilon subunit-like protein